MDNPIFIKDFAEKYNIYSYSMMRRLYKEQKLATAEKIWNVIVVDELIELENIKQVKERQKKRWRKLKNSSEI